MADYETREYDWYDESKCLFCLKGKVVVTLFINRARLAWMRNVNLCKPCADTLLIEMVQERKWPGEE